MSLGQCSGPLRVNSRRAGHTDSTPKAGGKADHMWLIRPLSTQAITSLGPASVWLFVAISRHCGSLNETTIWHFAMPVVGADFSIRIVWFAYKFSSLKFVGQYHHPLESLISCDRQQPRPHPPIDFVSKISESVARESPTIPLINQRFICLNNVVSVHAIP